MEWIYRFWKDLPGDSTIMEGRVYSKQLMSFPFWIVTIAIVVYMTSMWTSGITQGLMWKAFNIDGTLQYSDFVETVTKIVPFYFVRFLAGVMYLTGIARMLYNFCKSVAASKAVQADLSDTKASAPRFYDKDDPDNDRAHNWHHRLEGKALQFSVFTMVAVLIGGLFEIIPTRFDRITRCSCCRYRTLYAVRA